MGADGQLSPPLHFAVKAAGAVALLTYLFATRFYFDLPILLFAMLLLSGGVFFYAWTSAIFQRGSTPLKDPPVPYHPSEAWLVATEDGVLLLPLIFVGINVFSALPVAIAFVWLQLRSRPLPMALALGIPYYLVVLWVLPQGIWMVFVAHVAAELIMRKMVETPARVQSPVQPRA